MSGWVAGEDLSCSVRYFMDVVGGKWKISILCILSDGAPYRYSYIRKRLGYITNTTLSKSLQELEKDGILNRKQYPEIPSKVEYSLTEKGLSLIPVIVCMGKWGIESCDEEKEQVYCKACKSK